MTSAKQPAPLFNSLVATRPTCRLPEFPRMSQPARLHADTPQIMSFTTTPVSVNAIFQGDPASSAEKKLLTGGHGSAMFTVKPPFVCRIPQLDTAPASFSAPLVAGPMTRHHPTARHPGKKTQGIRLGASGIIGDVTQAIPASRIIQYRYGS